MQPCWSTGAPLGTIGAQPDRMVGDLAAPASALGA